MSNLDSGAVQGSIKTIKISVRDGILHDLGWAILIIAVVLVALFQMGVFNSANFAPKVQPGACQVFKTTASTSLEGICNNMLPQYVAQFNGYSGYISIGNPAGLYNPDLQAVSVSAWVNVFGSAMMIFSDQWAQQLGVTINPANVILQSTTNGANWISYSAQRVPSGWYFVTITGVNSIGDMFYVNGVVIGSVNSVGAVGIGGGSAFIGGDGVGGSGCCSYNFNGLIVNVQIYNTSLSANDVQALYLEGIGGAPQNTQNLVGWWPLNGNANDYSGNNNNGAANNVIYTGSWESAYSAP